MQPLWLSLRQIQQELDKAKQKGFETRQQEIALETIYDFLINAVGVEEASNPVAEMQVDLMNEQVRKETEASFNSLDPDEKIRLMEEEALRRIGKEFEDLK